MRSRILVLAILLVLPAAAATSTLYEFHGDLGPIGSEVEQIAVPAGTSVVRAVFHISPSVLPVPIARWDVNLEFDGSSVGCGMTYPHPLDWDTCTLTIAFSTPTSAAGTARLLHVYRGVFHGDIVVTAD